MGGVTAGFLAWPVLVAYVEAFPLPGLQSIGLIYIVMPTAILIGAGGGAAIALRLREYQSPVSSGFVFALALAALVPAIAGAGAVLLPIDIGDVLGALLVSVSASGGAAWLCRAFRQPRI